MVLSTRTSEKLYSAIIDSSPKVVCNEISIILGVIKDHVTLDENNYFDVKVILNELLQNAIKHGNCMNRIKKIVIDVWIKNKKYLDISVKDEGIGFNPSYVINSKRRKCNDSIINLDECGRGLVLISNLCDNIKFNNKGNKVTIRKNI